MSIPIWCGGLVTLLLMQGDPRYRRFIESMEMFWPFLGGSLLAVTLLTGAGIASVFLLRSATVVDLRRGRVSVYRYLPFPVLSRHYPLELMGRVDLRRCSATTRTGGLGWHYDLRLETRNGTVLPLSRHRHYEEAREASEWLGAGLSVPVIDRSLDECVERDPMRLDAPPSDFPMEGPIAAKAVAKVVERPANPRCQIELRGKTSVVVVPPHVPGWYAARRNALVGAMGLSLAAIPLIPLLALGLKDLREAYASLLPASIVGGLILFAFFGAYRLFLGHMATREERIEWDPSGLTVTKTGLLSRTERMRADEVEELVITRASTAYEARSLAGAFFGESPILVIRSDAGSIKVGHGLERGELEWLKSLLVEEFGR